MVYQYKMPGLFRTSAQAAGEVCAMLESSADGLSAKSLVNASRDKNAPLHDEFEWDDAVAGELYREGQARVLICNIVKVPTETVHSEPIRAFVKVNKAQSNGTYHNIQTVMEDDYLKAQLFMAAQRDMDAFIRKYHNLEKLAGVINAMRLVS